MAKETSLLEQLENGTWQPSPQSGQNYIEGVAYVEKPEGILRDEIIFEPLEARVRDSVINGTKGNYFGRFSIAAKEKPKTDLMQYRYHKYKLDYQQLHSWDAYYTGKTSVYGWNVYNPEIEDEITRNRKYVNIESAPSVFRGRTCTMNGGGIELINPDGTNTGNRVKKFYFETVSTTPVTVDIENALYGLNMDTFNSLALAGSPRFTEDAFEKSHLIDLTYHTAYNSDPFRKAFICGRMNGTLIWNSYHSQESPFPIGYFEEANSEKLDNIPTGKQLQAFKEFGGGDKYIYEWLDEWDIDEPPLPYVARGNGKNIAGGWMWTEHDGWVWGDKDDATPFHYGKAHFARLHKDGCYILAIMHGATGQRNAWMTPAKADGQIYYTYYFFTPDSYTDGEKLYNVYEATPAYKEIGVSSQFAQTFAEYGFGWAPSGSGIPLEGLYKVIPNVPSEYPDSYVVLDKDTALFAEEEIDFMNDTIMAQAKAGANIGAHLADRYVPIAGTGELVPLNGKYIFAAMDIENYERNDEIIYLRDYADDNPIWEVLNSAVEWPYYVLPQVTYFDWDYIKYETVVKSVIPIHGVFSSDINAYKNGIFYHDKVNYPDEWYYREGPYTVYMPSVDLGVSLTEVTSRSDDVTIAGKDCVSSDGLVKYFYNNPVGEEEFSAGDYVGEAFFYGSTPIEGDEGAYMGYYYKLVESKEWDGYLYDQYITGINYKEQMGSGKLLLGSFISSQVEITLKALPKAMLDYFGENKYIKFRTDATGENQYLVTACELQSNRGVKITAVSSLESLPEMSIDSTIDLCRDYPVGSEIDKYKFNLDNPAPVAASLPWTCYWLLNSYNDKKYTVAEYPESDIYEHFSTIQNYPFYIDLEMWQNNYYLSALKVESSANNKSFRAWLKNLGLANLKNAKPMQTLSNEAFFDFNNPMDLGLIDNDRVIDYTVSKKDCYLNRIQYSTQYKEEGFYSSYVTEDEEHLEYRGNPFMVDDNYLMYRIYCDPDKSNEFEYRASAVGFGWKTFDQHMTPEIDRLYAHFSTGSITFMGEPVTDAGYIRVGDVIQFTSDRQIDNNGQYITKPHNLIVTGLETNFSKTTLKCEVDVKAIATQTSSGMTL